MIGLQRNSLGILSFLALLLMLFVVASVILGMTMNKRGEVATVLAGLEEREHKANQLLAEVAAVEASLKEIGAPIAANRETAKLFVRLQELTERRDWLKRQLAISKSELPLRENDRRRLLARIESLDKAKTLHKVNAQRARKEVKDEIKLLKLDLLDFEDKITEAQTDISAIAQGKARRVAPLLDGRETCDALYVECGRDGIVVMPAGDQLSTGGAASAHQSLLEKARNKKQIMFFVRPDGFSSFQAYRDLVASAGVAYGYQPIDSDWKLIYPSD